MNDDRQRREVIRRETEYEKESLPLVAMKSLNVSYPLVVVGLFKSIVVVDRK